MNLITLLRSSLPEHGFCNHFVLHQLYVGVHITRANPNCWPLWNSVDCGLVSSFLEGRDDAFSSALNLGAASRYNCSLNTPSLYRCWESEVNLGIGRAGTFLPLPFSDSTTSFLLLFQRFAPVRNPTSIDIVYLDLEIKTKEAAPIFCQQLYLRNHILDRGRKQIKLWSHPRATIETT